MPLFQVVIDSVMSMDNKLQQSTPWRCKKYEEFSPTDSYVDVYFVGILSYFLHWINCWTMDTRVNFILSLRNYYFMFFAILMHVKIKDQ